MYVAKHRDSCPKCGGNMVGPTFADSGSYRHECVGGTYEEHLVYHCATCGYGECRPTKDAKVKP